MAPVLPAFTLLDSYPDDLVAAIVLAWCSPGADSTCDLTFSIWILAAGITGLMLYEPISSQIDRLVCLETANFEDLTSNFTDGLVPRIH